MKIAFLILAHKNPGQVLRLIDRLDSPDTSFFVHVDRRAPESVSAPLEARAAIQSNLFCTPRRTCRWGNFGIVEATQECIRMALLSKHFDYAILLSGQDYPLKSLPEIQDYLTQRRGLQFIEAFRLDQPNRWTPMGGAYQAMNKVQLLTVNIRSRRVHVPVRRKMPMSLHPFGGSQWWGLTRDCLMHVERSEPALSRFFRNVFIPDESFFQTIVGNSPFASRMAGDLHLIDWTRPNPMAPRTFDASDLELLRGSDKLFCRKVDDVELMDMLDNSQTLAA